MSNVSAKLRDLLQEFSTHKPDFSAEHIGEKLAVSLGWKQGPASITSYSVKGVPGRLTRACLDRHPAALFVSSHARLQPQMIDEAALYAYHASIEWGLVACPEGLVVFNSHWLRRGYWFHLPEIAWADAVRRADVFNSMTPTALAQGQVERVAAKSYAADQILVPVDDALVECLDSWRDEALRHTPNPSKIDERLQGLFAQFFVLRAVEDRGLAPDLPSLQTVLNEYGGADGEKIECLFQQAREKVQSELFDDFSLGDVPSSVLGGIITDLYTPRGIPIRGARYNFAWIDADVLGTAYEKYLSTLLAPAAIAPQLKLWEQPLRGVERVAHRKAAGVYYTPPFLVRYLTEKCLDRYFARADADSRPLPRIADISCGSGSFLVTAVDSLVRRLRERDPQREWARELVDDNSIIGIDIDARAVTLAKLSLWLRLAQEPDALPLPCLDKTVIQGDSLADDPWSELPDTYDIILGNPPFIASGTLQSREQLGARYESAQGRYDYSYLFVELAQKRLAKCGLMGLVVPNRLFRNRDASAIREILSRHCNLASIVDFGPNEVFPGTSAYVGTLIAAKDRDCSEADHVRFIDVALLPPRFPGAMLSLADSNPKGLENEYLSAYDAPHPRGPDPWLLLSQAAKTARVRLEEGSEPLGSIALVLQGIRTGANDIFIVEIEGRDDTSARVRNGFGDAHTIEVALLRPVLFGSDIQRYDRASPVKHLVYPYRLHKTIREEEMRREFPHGWDYFCSYRDMLAQRHSITSKGQAWYELIRKREEAWQNSKKLLIRDLATRTSFALDDTGSVFLVGGTAVIPHDPELLVPLLGYLNSGLANWYVSHATPAFSGGFQKFEPQHLQVIPVPSEIRNEGCTRDRLIDLTNCALNAVQSGDADGLVRCEQQIDEMLCCMAGIHLSEVR